MRAFYAIALILFLAAITVFAVQNLEEIPIKYPGGSFDIRLAILIGGVYFLGMLSGWTVVGLIKKSLKHVTERPHEH